MTKKLMYVVSSGKFPEDQFAEWLYIARVPEDVDVFEATGIAYWDVPDEVVEGPFALQQPSIEESIDTIVRYIYNGTGCMGCYTLIGFNEEDAKAINQQVSEKIEALKAEDAAREQARLVREWRKRQLLAA